MAVRFNWNPRKAAGNRRTHGVSFEEAATPRERRRHEEAD